MPQTIGGVNYPTAKEVEDIIHARGLSGKDAQELRLEGYKRRNAAMIQSTRGDLSLTGSPLLGIQNAVSGAANYFNTAAFGAPVAAASHGAALLSRLNPDMAGLSHGERYEIMRESARQALGASPVGQTAGTVAAFFKPSLASTASTGFGRLVGAEKLANTSVQLFEADKKLKSGVALLGSALLNAAGSQIGYETAAGAVDAASSALASIGGDRSVDMEESFGDRARRIFSPTNVYLTLGLSAAGTGLNQLARGKRDFEAERIVEWGEKHIPGFKRHWAMLHDPGSARSAIFDMMARTAMGRRIHARYLKENVIDPLRKASLRLRGKYNVSDQALGDTADDIRNLVGRKTEIAGGKDVRGTIQTEMDRLGNDMMAGRKKTPISDEQAEFLFKSLRRYHRHRRALGETTSKGFEQLDEVIDKLHSDLINHSETIARQAASKAKKLPSGYRITLGELDDMRKILGEEIVWQVRPATGKAALNQPSAKSQEVAKMMYDMLRHMEGIGQPKIEKGLKAIRELRQALDVMKPLAQEASKGADALDQVEPLFKGNNFKAVWNTFVQHRTKPQVANAQGAYIGKFLDAIYNEKADLGLKTADRIKRLWQGAGDRMFARDHFDHILGAKAQTFADEMIARAELYDLARKTVARAEGSPTFARGADAIFLGETFEFSKEVIESLIRQNKGWGSVFEAALNGAAMFGAVQTILNGKVAQKLMQGATGQAFQVGTKVPVALEQGRPLQQLMGEEQ
jgi:hypothetical protein